MQGKKTLLFMLWNPTSFLVYFLACWILFSATFTTWDESFRYGTGPDAAEAAEGAFANLPGSLWNLVTALLIIIEDIVHNFFFSYKLGLFIAPIALAFSYREARSSRNGVTTERQVWMQWYDRQQIVKAERGTYERPPLSEYIPGGSYFISARKTVLFMFRHPILPAGHFILWFTLFALPILFDRSDFVRLLPKSVIPAVIVTLILSYREARSNLKGVAIERAIWTKWYHQQTQTIAQGGSFGEPPSSENMKAYSYFGEIPETLFFMARNLKSLIVHLTCWVSTYTLLFITTLPPSKTPDDIFEIFDLIGIFGYLLPWVAIIVFVISYREARGNLKGTTKAQRVWMRWYHRQQKTVRLKDTVAEPPPSENTQADSYFRTVLKTMQFMVSNPMPLVVHLTCWFSVFIFLSGGVIDLIPTLFVAGFALISSYQEARGNVKGVAKEGAVWTKWYQRQTEAKTQGYTLAELPPAINVR